MGVIIVGRIMIQLIDTWTFYVRHQIYAMRVVSLHYNRIIAYGLFEAYYYPSAIYTINVANHSLYHRICDKRYGPVVR